MNQQNEISILDGLEELEKFEKENEEFFTLADTLVDFLEAENPSEELSEAACEAAVKLKLFHRI